MAQYGINLYGTSYYGDTNAINGFYMSEVINAREKLNTNFSIEMIVDMPQALYEATDKEWIYEGTWNTSGTSKVSTSVTSTAIFKGSLAGFTLDCSGTGSYTIRKSVNGVWSDVESGSLSGGLVRTNYEYAMYEIKAVGTITLRSIKAMVCDIQFFTKTSIAGTGLDAIEYIKATRNSKVSAVEADVIDLIYPESRVVTQDTYKLVFTSNDETTDTNQKQFYQFKLEMVSSDNLTTPAVRSLVMNCGDTTLYDINGEWNADIDFGEGFKTYKIVDWESDEDIDTSIEVKTASSFDGSTWGHWSNPYSKDPTQIRLEPNQRQGTIKVPLASPRHLKYWMALRSKSYDLDTRRDDDVIPIRYEFFDANNKPVGPVIMANAEDLKNVLLQDGRAVPMYAIITLERAYVSDNTPQVDSFELISQCEYSQMKNLSASVSRVYGEKKISDIIGMNFTDRPEDEYGDIEYTITPHVGSKLIQLYWESERDSQFRDLSVSTVTNSDPLNTVNDRVCAVSSEQYYFGYGACDVQFASEPTVVKLPMINNFRSLYGVPIDTSIKYQYKVFNRWVTGEDLHTTDEDHVATTAEIIWEHSLGGDYMDITDKSEINGYLVDGNPANDNMVITVHWNGEVAAVPWKSAYYTYNAVVNPNGLHIPYSKSDVMLPPIDPFAYTPQDCYKFEIVPGSIKRNGITVPDQSFKLTYDIIYPTDEEIYIGGDRAKPRDEYLVIDVVTHSVNEGSDRLRYAFSYTKGSKTYYAVDKVLGIWDTYSPWPRKDMSPDYIVDLDYTIDYVTSTVVWKSPEGVTPPPHEPNVGDKYYVYYICRMPKTANVEISSSYKESKVIKNEPWTSLRTHEETGTCSPGVDYASENLKVKYPATDVNLWGYLPAGLSNIRYTVIDDNPWVETTVDNPDENTSVVKGSVGLRNSEKNWYPLITPGFYYTRKREYYHYIDPAVVEYGRGKIEYAENIKYKDSAVSSYYTNGAVLVEDGSQNLIVNSGFDIKEMGIAYRCRFSDMASVATGPSKSITWTMEV